MLTDRAEGTNIHFRGNENDGDDKSDKIIEDVFYFASNKKTCFAGNYFRE